jgi:RNA polymerase sigma factor (TIGR02999 family)
MRRILTDYARSRQSLKRGADAKHLSLDEVAVWASESCGDLVPLDDALNRLAAFDSRKSQVVELRFFGGLSLEETADILKVSPVTVARDWKLAKAWLYKELNPERGSGS